MVIKIQYYLIDSTKLEGRIDPNPYHPVRLNAVKKIKNLRSPLEPLIKVAPFKKNLTESKLVHQQYLGLENVESGTGIYLKSETEKEEFDTAFEFSKGNVLFPKLRPYLNKIHLAEFDGVCSTEFFVLECNGCRNDYLTAFLNSNLVLDQTTHLMTGNTHPRLQTEEIEQLLIPIPNNDAQKQIGEQFHYAQKKKDYEIRKSHEILQKFENLFFEKIGLRLPKIKNRKVFTFNKNNLENALNPERYSGVFTFNPSIKWVNILKFGNLVKEVINPEQRQKETFSVIRIDDLEKNPIKADPRISVAEDIEGNQLAVQENDVLIARLGPSIKNKKIIICPKSTNQILASPEFLVFRCNNNANPLFVMALLKTDFFTQLMFQKSRGATPSRFRLDSSDFEQFNFPDVNKTVQDNSSKEITRLLDLSYKLRKTALVKFNDERNKIENKIISACRK